MVTDRTGVPLTNTVPASMSRSSCAASSEWAATANTFSRTASVASRAAPPATTAVRLPPVPGPYGVDCVSAWTIVTSSKSTPRLSATICAIVVSTLWPWEVVPRYATTLPLDSTRTVAPSVAKVGVSMQVGST